MKSAPNPNAASDICPWSMKCEGFVPLTAPSWGNSIHCVYITSSLKWLQFPETRTQFHPPTPLLTPQGPWAPARQTGCFSQHISFCRKDSCGIFLAFTVTPGKGRSPGEGNGNPLQYSCLENPVDRGAWQTTVHGVRKTWTHLSNQTAAAAANPATQ